LDHNQPQRAWNIKTLLLLTAVFALPSCVVVWGWMTAIGLGYQGTVRPPLDALAWDWAIFHTAARAWYEGSSLVQVYDQVWLKHMMDTGSWQGLQMSVPYPGFHYPPIFLMMLLPFGALSFGASYALAQLTTFLAMMLALWRRFAGEARRFRLYAASLLLCPASITNIVSGQNVFLIAALYILGFSLLDSQPFLAGIIAGAACFKPQMALLVPVAFIASRNWRALAGMIVSGLVLTLVSGLIFGVGLWEQWLNVMLHPRQDVAYTGIAYGRMWDDSAYTIAKLLGAPEIAANVAQGCVMAVAAGCVFYVYLRRLFSSEMKFSVVMAASVAAAPHVSQYDMVLLAYAATSYIVMFAKAGIRPAQFIIPCLAWLLPFFCPPIRTVTGDAVPLVVFALIFVLISRASKAQAASDLAHAGMPA
jgi:hypothetical protein